jgi:hypothetical protein
MVKHKDNNNELPFCEVFLTEEYLLTTMQLEEQADASVLKVRNWYSSSLQFLSYKDGRLSLTNTYNKQAFHLVIQAKTKKHSRCLWVRRYTSFNV